jgi:acetate kinase
VFAGGIGERSELLREKVVVGVRCLGFELDPRKNRELGSQDVVSDVTTEGAGKKVLVCRTDEEVSLFCTSIFAYLAANLMQFEMARACAADPKL